MIRPIAQLQLDAFTNALRKVKAMQGDKEATEQLVKEFLRAFEADSLLTPPTEEVEVGFWYGLYLRITGKPKPRRYVFPKMEGDTVTFRRPHQYAKDAH